MIKKVLLCISFAASFLSFTTLAADAVVADPEHYTVEFENDKVRVLRVKYGPGEKSVMHTHGPNVVVFLSTNDAIRFTLPDGTTLKPPAAEVGAVQWADAQEHMPENMGDETLEIVLIELKE